MTPKYRTIPAIAVATVVALAAIAGSGATAKPRYASTITIGLKVRDLPVVAFGHVRSDDRRCKDRRKVVLLNETRGQKLDTFRTGPTGKWKLKIPGSVKRSVIDLSARVKPRETHSFACGAARSGTVPAPAHTLGRAIG